MWGGGYKASRWTIWTTSLFFSQDSSLYRLPEMGHHIYYTNTHTQFSKHRRGRSGAKLFEFQLASYLAPASCHEKARETLTAAASSYFKGRGEVGREHKTDFSVTKGEPTALSCYGQIKWKLPFFLLLEFCTLEGGIMKHTGTPQNTAGDVGHLLLMSGILLLKLKPWQRSHSTEGYRQMVSVRERASPFSSTLRVSASRVTSHDQWTGREDEKVGIQLFKWQYAIVGGGDGDTDVDIKKGVLRKWLHS